MAVGWVRCSSMRSSINTSLSPRIHCPHYARNHSRIEGAASDGESGRRDSFVSTRLISEDQFRDNVRYPDRRDRRMDASPTGCKHKLQGRHGE